MGIQGWRNYRLPADVTGTVVHAAGSTDGFYTVDLAIEKLTVDSKPVEPLRSNFIRIEVLPFRRKSPPLPVCRGEEVRVSGQLMWDADGFLEIHPKHSNEIVILNHTCL